MENRELARLRGEIDRIDAQLLALFLERMRVVDEIGATKRGLGLPVRDEAREAELLARIRAQAGEQADEAEALFRALLDISRGRQERGRGDT
jgi:monofunctional chorismate mutase